MDSVLTMDSTLMWNPASMFMAQLCGELRMMIHIAKVTWDYSKSKGYVLVFQRSTVLLQTS